MGDTIIGVQFGIANPDEIISKSVVEVISDKPHQMNQPVAGGVFDARFGVIENGKICPTCKQTNLLCPGHFGHIRLARPVYLYQFIDQVQKILQNVCLNCSNPYLPDEELEIIAAKTFGIDRFAAVHKKTAKYKEKLVKDTGACTHCKTPLVKKTEKMENTVASLQAITYDEIADPIPLQCEMVLRCFQRITDKHIELIGFNPKFSRPEWMICTVLLVPPLTVRPSVIMEDNQRMEDDLTHMLITIVRDNQRLRDKIDKGDSADIINKYTELLQFDVATYVDNEIKGLPPAAQRSGRPLKTLKSRLGAKNGRVRGNLMGKRVDFSARSVITPDANIDLDELGVPEEIAMNLTFPEIVTPYNRDRLLSYIRNGTSKYPGAKSIVFTKNEKRSVNLKFITVETIDINVGDIVHRHLIDGDVVLFNRQPSLHKASMECHRIRVLPYSTFRLNVSATRPYNADFDGDEMNMHVPQSIASAMELKYLAPVLRQIISPRLNSPIIQIFQDTLTGAYRISQDDVRVPEYVAMNLLARMKKPFNAYDRRNRPLTGKEIISKAFPLMNYDGPIKLENGELTKGYLKKSAFGKASEGIIHVLYNDFGPDRAGQFINDVQNIVTKYNLYTGFSVGTADLIANDETADIIKKTLEEGRRKVTDIMTSVHAGTFINASGRSDGEHLENEIMNALKEVNSTIERAVSNSLPKSNRMFQMVESGSKGSNLNITQMMALLGQQLIAGRRVKYTLQDRTLPHFGKYDDGIESRGFVENSFISGIRPAEFFFHAMGGREGLIDTAVKTSDSGYIQRKLVKIMEDLRVEYDGTVRNVNGSIVQFVYGGDGAQSICVEVQPIDLAVMSMEQVYREFAASVDDFKAVVNGDVGSAPDLIDQILKDREVLVKDVFRYVKNTEVSVPVHIKRILAKYENKYSVKTDLTPEYVVNELNALTNEPMFRSNKLFHILLRYYLAPKKSIINLRLTKSLFDDLLKDIRFKYMKSKVQAGEMVGTLAAQSVGEPTTQLTLNTFHSAGTSKANATQGVPRIVELLSVSHNPKTPSNVIYFNQETAVVQNAVFSKMKEIQKTTLRDISKSLRIYYDPDPTSKNTVIDEDRLILQSYEKFSITQQAACISPWIIRLELDPMEMAARNIVDMSVIQAKISNNKVLRVFECIHSDTNSFGKLIMRITFLPDTVKNSLSLRFIEDKLLDTVLTGIDGIGRVYPREVKKELMYDELVGGYVPIVQTVLDVEGANLLELVTFDNVDPYRSFSNHIHEIVSVFGIETARIALFEEFMETFSSESVNYHHMITLIDTMTFPGYLVSVDRFGMNKSDNGVLAKSSFEKTSQILFDAAISADFDNMKGVSANIMFGQKPPCGTGIVNILIDETRLPEGPEEDDTAFKADLDAANVLVEQEEKKAAAEGACKMEDILMEW